MQIDPSQPIPIYFQLKTLILEEILAGHYAPGERLPTEHEFCARLGVSRTPVSRALSELADEGVILRRRRSGSFVNPHWGPRPGADGELRVIVSDRGLEKQINACNLPAVTTNVSIVPFPDLRKVLTHAVAEGLAPDLAIIDSGWATEMAEAGFLWDLNELDPAWVADELANDLLPPFTASADLPLYSVVAEANVAGLWYRRDLLEAAGQPPPETWQQLVAVGKAIRQADATISPLVMPGGTVAGETTTYCLLAVLASNGVSILSEGRVTLNSDATVEALRLIRGLVDTGLLPPEVVGFEWDRAVKRLARGSAAMSLGGSYESPALAEASGLDIEDLETRYGFIAMPAGPRGTIASVAGGMAYAIFRQSRHPYLALKLLKAAMSGDSLAELARTTAKIPTRRSAVELVAAENPFIAQTASILEWARMRPRTERYHYVSRQLQVMLENVITLQSAPAAAAERAADLIGAITGLPVSYGAF